MRPAPRSERRYFAYILLIFCLLLVLHFLWPSTFSAFEADTKTITLSNGLSMPLVGFGTAAISDHSALEEAYNVGYRMFDTASDTGTWYHTEIPIGNLLVHPQENDRSQLFLVTKLHPQDHGGATAIKAFEQSLTNLQTDYVDLFLIHFPECRKDICTSEPAGTWKDTWAAVEQLYKNKKIKAIGVSNFNLEQLKELDKIANVKPQVLQMWYDPFHRDLDLIEYCKRHNIKVMAYSSLGSQWIYKNRDKPNPVFSSPVIEKIARETGKSISQVVLRWIIEDGIVVIPRSNNPEHIKQNFNIFGWSLSPEHRKILDSLNGALNHD